MQRVHTDWLKVADVRRHIFDPGCGASRAHTRTVVKKGKDIKFEERGLDGWEQLERPGDVTTHHAGSWMFPTSSG